MEREIKKRGREGKELMAAGKERVGVAESSKKARRYEISDAIFEDGSDIFKESGAGRPLGVFEFPWQQEGLEAAEPYGCDLLDVFFSSLVDGSSAAIGFPGDRLFQAPAMISLSEERDDDSSWPLDGGLDGCIWSCVLGQPLFAVYSKGSSA